MEQPTLRQRIDTAIAQYAMLKHPFYQSWSEGKLDRSILKNYATQYYAHVKAFPTYVSGVHSHCDDIEIRQSLLENLIEEERGGENHPELWLRFADELGASRKEIKAAELLPSTVESVQTLKSITGNPDYRVGLAGLYAYESQIPEVAKTKRTGLKDFYGIDDTRAISFFTVHETMDVLHSESEIEALSKSCLSDGDQEAVVEAAGDAAQALWNFLSGVERAYFTS